MQELDIISVLEHCGCRKVRVYGEEVRSTCPDEAMHSRGMDRNPSFSARVNLDGYSPYLCQACGLKGTMEFLAREHGLPQYMPERKRKVDPEDWFPADNRKLWGGQEEDPGPMFPPEASLKPYQGGIPRYLMQRGVKLDTANVWELGYDREYKRAVFTIRDTRGRLRGVCGRAIFGGQKPKYCHYSMDKQTNLLLPFVDYDRYQDFIRPEKRLVCYGEHMVPKDVRRLVVTEGHLDVVMSWQAGAFAVGLQGSSPSDEQVQTILGLLDRRGDIVMAFDPDEAGDKGRAELYEKIDGRVPLYNITFQPKTDPAKMVLEDAGAYRDLVDGARIYQC